MLILQIFKGAAGILDDRELMPCVGSDKLSGGYGEYSEPYSDEQAVGVVSAQFFIGIRKSLSGRSALYYLNMAAGIPFPDTSAITI